MPKVDTLQLEPCIGPEQGTPCIRGEGSLADPAVQGYDKLWRCTACNKIHTELVFQESGESAPNPGEAAQMAALPAGSFYEKRRAAMMNRIAKDSVRGGRFTVSSPVTLREGDPRDIRSHLSGKSEAPKETEEQRRARIVAKYQKRRGQT